MLGLSSLCYSYGSNHWQQQQQNPIHSLVAMTVQLPVKFASSEPSNCKTIESFDSPRAYACFSDLVKWPWLRAPMHGSTCAAT